MKATIPIAITPGTKVLRLERQTGHWWHDQPPSTHTDFNESSPVKDESYWQLWIHANRDITEGTVLRLYDNGSIDNITIDHDGIERLNFRVKDADK